ncbi:hypothetical protein Pla175_22690 [Pirellulimonas nuda]|uniref:Uncharacterized protein n=1 Tax=Pirellulimonas nuda TaxID=2528009 RepID=A0A518DBM2_9BACT|nr:hypothetical protein [Pirellulimonas nuda]QDU88885.1 hypothetical protein Pla175_22690 [Pirellulimonas nuda]
MNAKLTILKANESETALLCGDCAPVLVRAAARDSARPELVISKQDNGEGTS